MHKKQLQNGIIRNATELMKITNKRAARRLDKRKSRTKGLQIMPTVFPCVFQDGNCGNHDFCQERYLRSVAEMMKAARGQQKEAGDTSSLLQAPLAVALHANRDDAPGSSPETAITIDGNSEIQPYEPVNKSPALPAASQDGAATFHPPTTFHSNIHLEFKPNGPKNNLATLPRVSHYHVPSGLPSKQDPRMNIGFLTSSPAVPPASINEASTARLSNQHPAGAEPSQRLPSYHPLRWSFDDDDNLNNEWLDKMQA
jgi:hypothetical protein